MRLLPISRIEMSPMRAWSRDLDLFDQYFDDFLKDVPLKSFAPMVDISETKKDIVVRAELPGMDPKDIELTLDKGMLTISGERKEEKEEEDENCYCKETSYGSFRRSIRVPADADTDSVTADYKSGVLKVKIAKLNGKDRKIITVEAK